MASLGEVFNHIVLPTKLPGNQDADLQQTSADIINRLVRASNTLRDLTIQGEQDVWDYIVKLLRRFSTLHARGCLERDSLILAFENISYGHPLILHILEQNAALFVRCNVEGTIMFEAFEIATPLHDVLEATTALKRTFPDCIAFMRPDDFHKPSFQQALAEFLEKASMEALQRFQAKVTKAGHQVVETRDTTNPALITHVLIPLLECLGSPASGSVRRTIKHVRDDCNIKNAELPWRRLPLWLAIRVCIQRELQERLGSSIGNVFYKFLIVTLHTELLNDSVGALAPELAMTLRTKICRRLAKLERLRSKNEAIENLFSSMTPFFSESIESAVRTVDLAWTRFKQSSMRRVPQLPLRADIESQRLSLPNSGSYLGSILNLPRRYEHKQLRKDSLPVLGTTIKRVQRFTDVYYRLSATERNIEMKDHKHHPGDNGLDGYCTALCQEIHDLFDSTPAEYLCDPTNCSSFVLSLFSLWVRLDKAMIEAYPLLRRYHPVFFPELLNALHLPELSDMGRLLHIQQYIHERCTACDHQSTILSEPTEHGFVVQYMMETPSLQHLLEKINRASAKAKKSKQAELSRWSDEFDQHTSAISSGTCVCQFNKDGSRNVKGCNKCYHWRVRSRMSIEAHEDFLPSDRFRAAAIIFELGGTDVLLAYRNATWRILKLAHPEKPDSQSPIILLNHFGPLAPFGKQKSTGITLASTTKSFSGTHYKVRKNRMKASESDVLYPNGLTLFYYDTTSNTWVRYYKKPLTLQHVCGIAIPPQLLGNVLPNMIHPPTEKKGPSSYEIVASETKCPRGMSVHEFTAFQRLLSGSTLRWPTMLAELGASNFNFSSDETMKMFSHLAVQAGPIKDQNSLLRDTHVIFTDESFCMQLANQVRIRMKSIEKNWREVQLMELLITLALRLHLLSKYQLKATDLLMEARTMTLNWIASLRVDIQRATTASAAQSAAGYALRAALLCRRTFSYIGHEQQLLQQDGLSKFVQASLVLQQTLVKPEALTPVVKDMLIRDTKMAHNLRDLLVRAIEESQHSISEAINQFWSRPIDSPGRNFTSWQKVQNANDQWLVSTMHYQSRNTSYTQLVHYNFMEGHLLVDGEPLGRLPPEIQESQEVKELLGGQNILTYSSSEPGMSYALAILIEGHHLHFGVRNGHVIVRARCKEGLLEYIPPQRFTNPDLFDIPYSLITDCVHWLNLDTNCMEIRRKPDMWRSKSSNWVINVISRHCFRNKGTLLVDPMSNLFSRVSGIFRYFEDPKKLIVFQPSSKKGSLSVELRHLELSFFVNDRGLLECRELGEEIDPNQDAGTLYGLDSRIVLRNTKNHAQRSIITPWGHLSVARRGIHVSIRPTPGSDYARFQIDDVLGRLSCAAEPRLLYAKALFHAITSFVLPDPLLKRKGTEEALAILQSSFCQPWTPLGDLPKALLKSLASLSPDREYYPKDKRILQTVSWNPELTTQIQHDAFEILVGRIVHNSQRVEVFSLQNDTRMKTLEPYAATHLRIRGITQRSLYERSLKEMCFQRHSPSLHTSRGQKDPSEVAKRVIGVAKSVRYETFCLNGTYNISSILQQWPVINGFHSTCKPMDASLSDMVEQPLASQWGSLVGMARHSDPYTSVQILFRLCIMTCNPSHDLDMIKIVGAFLALSDLSTPIPPPCASFNQYRANEIPTSDAIFTIISSTLPEAKSHFIDKARRKACEAHARRLARAVLEQWPSEKLSLEGFQSKLIDTETFIDQVTLEWNRLHDNRLLSTYVKEIQNVLAGYEGFDLPVTLQAWDFETSQHDVAIHEEIVPDTKELILKPFHSQDKITLLCHSFDEDIQAQTMPILPPENSSTKRVMYELNMICSSFESSLNGLRKEYGASLRGSIIAFEKNKERKSPHYREPDAHLMAQGIFHLRQRLAEIFHVIRDGLSGDDIRFHWLDKGDIWPIDGTPLGVMELLRSRSSFQYGTAVKESIVSYGILIRKIQRMLRIQNALAQKRFSRLQQELQNQGYKSWNPCEYPDWLLLEIDSNIMIRKEQVEVAHAIMNPTSKQNTVLQLNMGKGKTSCIVPMVVAVLGDGKQLCRLVVPKSLLLPTAQMIQTRLGGLVGREVRHLPFSRRTRLETGTLKLYADLHREILDRRGVILNAPEHTLSYKLSGLQHLVGSNLQVASEMMEFQSWLHSKCRDVLDECDVSLATKTQLIYPIGKQSNVDGHPHRWQVAQLLLSLVRDHLPSLLRDYPKSIDIVDRGAGFPIVHLLRSDVEDELHKRITDEICHGRTALFRLTDAKHAASDKMRQVLMGRDVNLKAIEHVAGWFNSQEIACKKLLLLRGLIQNRILILCLKKRWNVQYGLHPKRDPLAVPFEAKGVPSEQAEFGHPDAAIVFTCLAFYFTGLSRNQFNEALQHILASHDPSTDYDRWISDCSTLPEDLRHWNMINIEDLSQVTELWSHLRMCKNVLDHYMNHFVFPVHAKQFSTKLQASGWDIPLISKNDSGSKAEMKAQTTGFSGTNDNKMMLPLTIRQDDLPSLQHTNAEVLTYLLEERNRGYHCAARGRRQMSEQQFLRELQNNGIRILIDAGATILEMSNKAVAATWLDIDTRAQGAVYFSEDHRAMVLYRKTKGSIPLLATPFADRLDDCVVYLDEAHTRGIDLNFPLYARGALTLALGQTKDHTVQAAMRLRQLGTTQSLCFFAFPETHQSILDVCNLNPNDRVNSSHVVRWLLEQTCLATEQLRGLYISQGFDFCDRTSAHWANEAALSNFEQRNRLVKAVETREQQTLEQLYGNPTTKIQYRPDSEAFPRIHRIIKRLSDMKNLSVGYGRSFFSSALEEVEQEREVEVQVEAIREVQVPVHHKAFKFPGLHPTIVDFALKGTLSDREGIENVFQAMSRTVIGKKHGLAGTESRLFVSSEFMRTIVTMKNDIDDNFMRPVEWILYSPVAKTAVVIIAEEAELLIPLLRDIQSSARTHLLTYSTPATRKMLQFSGLTYYVVPALPTGHIIPRDLVTEVGIFAGRLYMTYDDCLLLNKFIEEARCFQNKDATAVDAANFLIEWLSMRRKGQDIMHTPAGYVCQGRPLDADHIFFQDAPSNHAGRIVDMEREKNDEADVSVDDDGDGSVSDD